MDSGILIASAGIITAIGGLYGAYVQLSKRKLESNDNSNKTRLDEFGQLLQGYKDLKNEYEEQVKQLRDENKALHTEIVQLKKIMRGYEQKLQEFESKQKVIKKEVKDLE